MLPSIIRVTGLDIYRDGGSMSASFQDDSGLELTLMFPVQLTARSPGALDILGYGLPLLERHFSGERISPVTGLISRDWKHESEQLTWEQASRILKTLEPLLDGFVTTYAHLYASMVQIANDNGCSR